MFLRIVFSQFFIAKYNFIGLKEGFQILSATIMQLLSDTLICFFFFQLEVPFSGFVF